MENEVVSTAPLNAQTETAPEPSDADLYRTMLLIRRVEGAIESAHRHGRINGSFHSSLGQESAAAGVCAVIRSSDIVMSTHRGHGHAIAKGVSARAVIGELYKRTHGTTGGRGGSMHLHDRSVGFYGETAIVGGSLPWAAGAAWARRRLVGSDDIAVAFAGDGAFANGVFAETLRTARHWSSPCLFVCENNGWAHSMPAKRVFGDPGSIAAQVSAMGIDSSYADGRDVREVATKARDLVEVARTGSPAFIEVGVYRVRPHSLSDADYTYRGKTDGADWLEKNDPLALQRSRLDEHLALAIEQDVDSEIDAAVDAAEHGVSPAVEAAEQRVYRTEGLDWRGLI